MTAPALPPAHAAGTGATGTEVAGTDVVGGARLARHGYVWDRSSGVTSPPHIQASSYVIADLETGKVLAAKDPHGHYRPASTLKTLTAITLIPRLDPAKKVKPSRNAVDASGSAVGMDTHWTYTVRDLFYGLLMQSGNDAAIALSEANGGLTPTLAEMNAEARRIRALDTVARTPNGLDDDPPLTLAQQHSSAYDLALFMKQGLTLPDFRKYVGRKLYHWPAPPTKKQREKGKKSGGWEIGTHDHLILSRPYRGMIGGKNGWTSHALGSFVGAATRNGHTIIISLMHAQSDFWGDARSLLDWGFAERDRADAVGALVDPVPPPSPTPTPATSAAAGTNPLTVRNAPGTGVAWWQLAGGGAGAAVVIAAAAGLIAGRRRRRLAPAGGDSGPPPSEDAPSDGGTPTAGTDRPGGASGNGGNGADDRDRGKRVDGGNGADRPPAGGAPPPSFGGGHVRTFHPAGDRTGDRDDAGDVAGRGAGGAGDDAPAGTEEGAPAGTGGDTAADSGRDTAADGGDAPGHASDDKGGDAPA